MLKPLVPALLAVALGLLLAGCDTPPGEHEFAGHSMGTEWSVKFVLPAERTDIAGLREEIEQALDTVDAQMSTWREDSDLTRFNRLEPGESIALPGEFRTVLAAALELAEDTAGAYDPTVGPLVNLWGFGPEGRRDQPPSEAEIEAARKRVGWARLGFDTQSGELTQPGGAYLDLSSIAKGHAADLIARHLEARGIEDYLINLGGDIRMRGHRPGGGEWRIAIERPDPGGRDIHGIIEPGDGAVATSGSYRNFFRHDGREFSHTIDPATGRPIPNALVSVTVVHDSAMWADGLATAITALGPGAGFRFASERGLAVLLLVREGDSIREVMTPEFARHLEER